MNSKNSVNVNELSFEMTKKLKFYLAKLVKHGGSDLHIKSGSAIRGRIKGEIVQMSKEPLSKNDGIELAKELLRGRFPRFVEEKNIDFTFRLNDEYRFRVNLFFQVDGLSGVFRTIPTTIPTPKQLRLPPSLLNFCKLKRGLVLVTGPTGSGKTTTLASLIDTINKNYKKHIITIEDPVEFVYKDQMSIVNQRAIGQDATDFVSALRASLREDPDVILVGEMRDLETIETAIHAAETGHLVFSTLHTLDTKETINRIIGMFSGSEQKRIQMSLASVLQGVVSQRLLRTKNASRVAAIEVMMHSTRIKTLILEGREAEITNAIKEGSDIYGSQTFDQALEELYKDDIITYDNALDNATSRNDLQMVLENINAIKQPQNTAAEKDIIKLKE